MSQGRLEGDLEVLLVLLETAREDAHEGPHFNDRGRLQGVSLLDDVQSKVDLKRIKIKIKLIHL